MPLEVLPNFARCNLSDVSPGSLIHYGMHLALVIVDPNANGEFHHLAIFKPDLNAFFYKVEEGNSTVRNFGDDLILDVDATEYPQEATLDYDAGLPLFEVNGSLSILLHVSPETGAVGLVNLQTMEYSVPVYHTRHDYGESYNAFKKWRLGLAGRANDPIWMIEADVDKAKMPNSSGFDNQGEAESQAETTHRVLSRTRRNMIGVSAVFILTKIMGWDVPDNLTIFGEEFSANSAVIGGILWLALAYFCYEYWVNVKDHTSGYRDQFDKEFISLHEPQALASFEKRLTDPNYEASVLRSHRQDGWQELERRPLSVTLKRVRKIPYGTIVSTEILLKVLKRGEDYGLIHVIPEQTIKYWGSKGSYLRTFVRLLLTDPKWLEYIFPMIIPILAVAINVIPPVLYSFIYIAEWVVNLF